MGNCLTEQNNFSRHPNIVVIIKRLSRLALSKFYQFYRVGVETAILLLGCSGVSKQHMSSDSVCSVAALGLCQKMTVILMEDKAALASSRATADYICDSSSLPPAHP